MKEVKGKDMKGMEKAKLLVFLKVNLLPGGYRLLLLGNVGLTTTTKETNTKVISLIRGH